MHPGKSGVMVLMVDKKFWKNKRVFMTGHTGFKGSWLYLWLNTLGAKITGYSLQPPTKPNLFTLAGISKTANSFFEDIRNKEILYKAIKTTKPEIVFHLAAQPLVRESYKDPLATFETNVMGTANLLEAIRKTGTTRAVINITTDKCYENREWCWGYRENEPLGGYDPYSSSKACSELVTSAYRASFFNNQNYADHGCAVASVRAGNVIGGGDWAADRLIPDCMRSLLTKKPIVIRNPNSIRPWQHVLEPLAGYLLLAENLFKNGADFAEAWNFGPNDDDAMPVEWIVKKLCKEWGGKYKIIIDKSPKLHEANYLKLDCSKAKARLGWRPKWKIEYALKKIVEWFHAYKDNDRLQKVTVDQISEYCACD
jgi:CDP-glucose 4,6-dehydratase